MKYFDESPILWTSLRTIGNSYPSRALVVAPFLAYAILFNSHISAFLGASAWPVDVSDVGGEIALLYFWYFGLVAFGTGSLCFVLACPLEIKMNADGDEFYRRSRETVTPDDLLMYCEYIGKSTYADDRQRAKAMDLKTIFGSRAIVTLNNFEVLFAKKAYFCILDKSRRGIRVLTFIGFVLGFVLISVPSVISLVRVIKTIAF